MARFVLIIAGVGLLLFGLKALVDPLGLWAQFGLAYVDEAAVRTELRAFYGGLELGLGAALLWHLATPRLAAGLVLCAFVYGGLGLGRLLGIVVDGPSLMLHGVALALELAIAGLAVAARLRLPSAP